MGIKILIIVHTKYLIINAPKFLTSSLEIHLNLICKMYVTQCHN